MSNTIKVTTDEVVSKDLIVSPISSKYTVGNNVETKISYPIGFDTNLVDLIKVTKDGNMVFINTKKLELHVEKILNENLTEVIGANVTFRLHFKDSLTRT